MDARAKMSDLITREETIKAITDYANLIWREFHEPFNTFAVIDTILNVPKAADVKPAVRGKWIWKSDKRMWECDKCGETTTDACMGKPRANFCPWCGADMRPTEDTE